MVHETRCYAAANLGPREKGIAITVQKVPFPDWDINAFQHVAELSASFGGRSSEQHEQPSLQPYKSQGFATGGVVVVDKGRGIEKTLVRPEKNGLKLWLNEARFYIELRDKISRDELYIPKLLNLRVIDRTTVKLTLEYMAGCPHITTLESRARFASAFGNLAGRMHNLGHHHSSWLPKTRGIGPVSSFTTGISTARKLLLSIDAGGAWRLIEKFIGNADPVRELYFSGIPTLCHGDAGHLNLMEGPSPSQSYIVIDWARVCSGMIGDDLARVIYPWLVTNNQTSTADEIVELEAQFLSRYTDGASSEVPDLDVTKINWCFQIQLVVLAISFARTYSAWLKKTKNETVRRTRVEQVRNFYRLVATRAARLMEFAGARKTYAT